MRDVRKASRRAWFEDLSDTAREVSPNTLQPKNTALCSTGWRAPLVRDAADIWLLSRLPCPCASMQVYAAAQRVQSALQPGQVADLHAFGQRLANELPNARVVLRRGAPKRAPSPVEDSTFGLRNLRHTFLVVQTGATGVHHEATQTGRRLLRYKLSSRHRGL